MVIHQNPLIGSEWCLPFLGSDKPIVARSQRHFYFHDKKRPIQFNIYFTVGSLFSTILFSMFAGVIALTAQFSYGRKLLRKYPKFFSLGFFDRDAVPDEEGNKSKEFSIHLIAEGWKETLPEPTDQFSDPPNKRVIFKVSGVDPGYYSTSTAVILCALTILDENNKMPDNGGVFTTGAAFANTTLLEKIHKNGIKFEFVSQTDI